MSIKRIGCVAVILLLSLAGEATTANGDEGLTAQLRQVILANLAAYNREDLAAAMKSVHTKSPEYGVTRAILPEQFTAFDARTELVSFAYIGHDDEFAVARVKLKTVDHSGADFSANVVDALTVFHQESGVWKVWSDHILGVELVR